MKLSNITDFPSSTHFKDIMSAFIGGFAYQPALLNKNRDLLVKNVKVYPQLYSQLKEFSSNISVDQDLNKLIFEDGKFHVDQKIYIVMHDKKNNLVVSEGVISSALGQLYTVTVDKKKVENVSETRLFMKNPDLSKFIGFYKVGERVSFFDIYEFFQGLIQQQNLQNYNVYYMNPLLQKYFSSNQHVLYFEKSSIMG